MSENTSIQIKKKTASALSRLKPILHKNTFNDLIEYFLDNLDKLRKQAIVKTDDSQLAEKYPCALRFSHEGFYYCHGKGFGILRKLLTLKACVHCKHRLDEQAFLEREQDIQKQRINALQLSLNDQIRKHKESFYPTCNPLERQTEHGYEIKSGICPNEKLRGEWHPPDVCLEIGCPYLQKVKVKKKEAST